MGLFSRRRARAAALAQSRAEEIQRLGTELDAIRTQLSGLLDRSLQPPVSPPPRLVDAEQLDHSLDDLRAHLVRLDEQVARSDERITRLTNELANQLSELGNEIEHLGANPQVLEPLARHLEELQSSQVHLANEQVRYQIALREDLAQLAERLKR